MIKAYYILGSIPILAFTFTGFNHHPKAVESKYVEKVHAAAPAEPTVRRVRTESIRPADDFVARWGTQSDPVIVVAQAQAPIPRSRPGDIEPVPEEERSRYTAKRKPHRVTPPHDICARHGMHKEVTRGGRSWRCRR